MFAVLESLPDFKIEMSFECESSFVPFLTNFTPSDTFTFYKKASSIRLDFGPKKQPKSFLFKGRGSQNEAEL